MSLNSDEEKAHMLHSCLKSPGSRISSPAISLKFLFSYGNIEGKAFKSERGKNDFLENTCRIRHLPSSQRQAALTTFAKRKIHPHNYKLHIFSAEEGSKRDVLSL